ncbi:hypothetical protein KVT40_002396 [Elsinoe batatas]|uniref:Uncharacterized protein n=1 Tax=Elsinoe batatas TaxID=2601811 RepID=A0A8K0L8A4_9PEZI|nr:hypothetical protein KVT40_002396 [Elsinoe batatas]
MARRRHHRSQAKPTKQRALPHFDSLPDEILLAICKATGCEPPRDDRFKEATQVARAMANSHAHDEDAVFVEKHPRELLPQSQPMAKVCRRVRAVFLDAHKDFKRPAHIYFLFPEKFTGFTCLEDVQHLEKVTMSPLMGLKLHVKEELNVPWPPTKRKRRALRLMASWTLAKAWMPVVRVLSYLPDHVIPWIRWPDTVEHFEYYMRDMEGMRKILLAHQRQPMKQWFWRQRGEGKKIEYSVEGSSLDYHTTLPFVRALLFDGITEVTQHLNIRR